MPETIPDFDMPWHVYATKPGKQDLFHSGYPTQTMAMMIAGNLSQYAENIKIETRYKVIPKPKEE